MTSTSNYHCDIILVWKEGFNCNGQQFHLSSNNWTWKKTKTYDVGNPVPDMGEAHKWGYA